MINKHAQRDPLFDEKVKEQVSFDRTLLRAATKAAFVPMETDKQRIM